MDQNVSFQSAPKEDTTPTIKNYPGFGDLVVGRSGDLKVLVTALCMFNDPQVNQYLLDNKLRLEDRITKTKIFPREGMALPNGEVYRDAV